VAQSEKYSLDDVLIQHCGTCKVVD